MKKFYLMIFAIVTLAGMLAISGCGKEKVYRVTFDANGGTGEMKEQAFAKDVSQALISNAFTREGYAFTGWNTIADGTGVPYSEAQEIVLTDDITLYAQWNHQQKNGHVYVDLGLPSGTKWATCNVGAANPEDFGSYFAWGETVVKETYNSSTYKYYDTVSRTYTKYNDLDGLVSLESTDDAATANWGAEWRMPTYNEVCELRRSCIVEAKVLNGVDGYSFIGPNGNSIFFPMAGRYSNNQLEWTTIGYYWSNSLSKKGNNIAYFYLGEDFCTMYSFSRYYGFCVRPVLV